MKFFKCIDFYNFEYYTNKVSKFEGTPLRTGAVFFCVKRQQCKVSALGGKKAGQWRNRTINQYRNEVKDGTD